MDIKKIILKVYADNKQVNTIEYINNLDKVLYDILYRYENTKTLKIETFAGSIATITQKINFIKWDNTIIKYKYVFIFEY